MTNDLVLQTRVGVLRRNLEEIVTALGEMDDRGTELRQLAEGIGEAKDQVWTLEIDVTRASQAASREPSMKRALDPVKRLTEDLRESVEKLEADARAMSTGWLAISGGVGGLLNEETVRKLERVEELQERVVKAGDDAALARVWQEYNDGVYDDSQQIFGEYVDLLGGLALRDAGFDQGVCRLADELIEQSATIVSFQWKSLAIPAAQRETLGMTVARIIRLGFPEWTIWALPLTAHELGHVLARNTIELRRAVAEVAKVDAEHAKILVPDAFATFAMGPAYAAPAILMRLDPGRACDEDNRLIAKRAAVILGTLRRTAQGLSNRYGKAAELLEEEWEAALRQAGAIAPPQQDDGAGSKSGSDCLTEADRKAVASTVEAVAEFMELPHRARSAAAWDLVDTAVDALAEDRVDEVELGFEVELRDVLNAAWITRLEAAEAGVAPGYGIEEIAERAKQLWTRVQLRSEERHELRGTDHLATPSEHDRPLAAVPPRERRVP